MKADLIYTLDHAVPYRRETIIIAKSGKWLDLGNWKPRPGSIVWGAWSPELAREADAINKVQEQIDARRKSLNAALCATQPALLAAAKAAPKDPPPEPIKWERPIEL